MNAAFRASSKTNFYLGNEGLRYGLNGQEKVDEIIGSSGTDYDFGNRIFDARLGRWLSVDNFASKYPYSSPYVGMLNNPIRLVDIGGDSVWVYATTLPGAPGAVGFTTHTFIVVKTANGVSKKIEYGQASNSNQLVPTNYPQSTAVMDGTDTEHLKKKILVDVPEGMTTNQFDLAVLNSAASFGNKDGNHPYVVYDIAANSDELLGGPAVAANCNSSASTVLSKAGCGPEQIDAIGDQLPGLNTGWGTIEAWTAQEQLAAQSPIAIGASSANTGTSNGQNAGQAQGAGSTMGPQPAPAPAAQPGFIQYYQINE